MSSIGTTISGLETSVARLLANAAYSGGVVPAPEPIPTLQAQARAAIRDARAQADAAAALVARDPRFDPPAGAAQETAPSIDAVRQVVDQIAATLAYQASVAVVKTPDDSVHATIDVSA